MKFNKKNLVLGLGVLSVATLGTVGITTNAFVGSNQEVRDAIANGDLEGFRTAISEQGNSRLQSRLENLDEEDFARIQERFQTREAINQAIEDNDFDAFTQATEGISKFEDLTQEDFDEMVAKRAERQQFKADLTASVESGNQDEFNNLITEKYDQKVESSRRGNFELTDERLNELWERANEQFRESGELDFKNLLKKGRKGGRLNRGVTNFL